MKINLKELHLLNFKGAKNVLIPFGPETNIFGANETGKTTINDAYTWLLFGKNSSDEQKFNIKTLDSKNNPIHKMEHEVKGVFDFSGSVNTLRRVYKEKWTKKRGFEEKEFDGHETLYFWNDVPVDKKEFDGKISVIIEETLFKLITNPLHFNSVLSWKERRTTLTKMAGKISNDLILEKIATPQNDCADLISALNQNKTVSEYKKEIANKKKLLKDTLEGITPRIDEVKRNTPQALDFELVETTITELKKQLKSIDDSLLSTSKQEEKANADIFEKKRKITSLNEKMTLLKDSLGSEKNKKVAELKNEIQTLESDLNTSKSSISNSNNTINELNNTKQRYETRIEELLAENEQSRIKWVSTNSEVFEVPEDETKCPTCKRTFESEDLERTEEQLKTTFNESKSKKLNAIKAKGEANKIEISGYEEKIKTSKEEIEKLRILVANKTKEKDSTAASLNTKKTALMNLEANSTEEKLPDEYYTLESEKEGLESIINSVGDLKQDGSLVEEKTNLTVQLEEEQKKLNTKEQISTSNKRVAELEEQEKKLSQEISNYEKIEFTIESFVSEKVKIITEKTNQMFKYVTFKMFEEQVNGGLKETCVAMVNGVPFSDLNTASQINAGIDIINALNKHYNVNAPIFIDNRESVTTLIPCESQIVNLIVSSVDKKLRIEKV